MAYPSIRCLEIEGPPFIDLQAIPQAVEELAFKQPQNEWISLIHVHPPFSPRKIRKIRFVESSNLSLSSVLYIRMLLIPIVSSLVYCEFEGCGRFRDGIFDLNDVQSAWIP